MFRSDALCTPHCAEALSFLRCLTFYSSLSVSWHIVCSGQSIAPTCFLSLSPLLWYVMFSYGGPLSFFMCLSHAQMRRKPSHLPLICVWSPPFYIPPSSCVLVLNENVVRFNSSRSSLSSYSPMKNLRSRSFCNLNAAKCTRTKGLVYGGFPTACP